MSAKTVNGLGEIHAIFELLIINQHILEWTDLIENSSGTIYPSNTKVEHIFEPQVGYLSYHFKFSYHFKLLINTSKMFKH